MTTQLVNQRGANREMLDATTDWYGIVSLSVGAVLCAHPAILRLKKQLCVGTYLVCDTAGRPLYVGSTTRNIRTRLAEHVRHGTALGRAIVTSAAQSADWPMSFWPAPCEQHARMFEAFLISRMRPSLNVAGRA